MSINASQSKQCEHAPLRKGVSARPRAAVAARLLRVSPLLFGLALCSCFETPVQESLRLRFLPNGAVVLTSRVAIAADLQASTAALQNRLREVRRVLAEGTDPWSQRFAALEPLAERSTWEKRGGELTEVVHAAVVEKPNELDRFFSDTGVQVSYVTWPEDGVAELIVTPGASNRASYRQRREMDAALAAWAEDLGRYFADASAVYDYADRRPERAEAVLAAVFGDLLPEGSPSPRLSREEESLVKKLDDSMGKVLEVLQASEGQAYSLDEISRLVYDPFPAKLELTLPAPARDVEGFARDGADRLSVRGIGLWDALRSLEGRWISPDPVTIYARSLTEGEAYRFDFRALLAQRRTFAGAPEPMEVREALVRALTPARTYRAAWAIRPAADPPAEIWEN